jgi:hypothetical protein
MDLDKKAMDMDKETIFRAAFNGDHTILACLDLHMLLLWRQAFEELYDEYDLDVSRHGREEAMHKIQAQLDNINAEINRKRLTTP